MGWRSFKKIRSWSNLPIIVISARSEDNDKIAALDAGADDYLTKPFSVEELLARLRVTQRRLSFMTTEMLAANSVFVNGGLRVDYAGGCAYLNNQELHLTPIEYKLFCLLSKKCGQGADPYLYHAADLGKKLGERCSIPARFLWQRFEKSWSRMQIHHNTSRRISGLAIG